MYTTKNQNFLYKQKKLNFFKLQRMQNLESGLYDFGSGHCRL